MLDPNSEEYQTYLNDQKTDGPGEQPDKAYLDYLFEEILPGLDKDRNWREEAKSWKMLDVGALGLL
jgi:hypothetical protein